MTRKEQMFEAASQVPRPMDFIRGAEWADENNILADDFNLMCEKKNLYKEKMLKYQNALSKIAMAQSGSMDYTKDFFEFVKGVTRDALSE